MYQKLKSCLGNKQAEMLEELEFLVNTDSGSYYKNGIDKLVDYYADKYSELGFQIEVDEQDEYGNNLIAKYKGEKEGNFLFLGHLDTVFAAGTAAERPFTIKGDRAYGPGVSDMKGGIVILYHTLASLINLEVELPNLTVILNGDEEIGTHSSRAIIEREGAVADYCFVLEPGRSDGSVVTQRKGVGDYELTVEGVASHSGADPEKGSSAIEELAHKILALHNLTDLAKGITVNVGVISGGERSNIIADQAVAKVDLRFETKIDGKVMDEKIRSVANSCQVVGTSGTIRGGLNRMPLAKTKASEQLYAKFCQTAARMNLSKPGEKKTGGASDGNYVSGLGVPTIDALGPVGGNSHSLKEYAEVATLTERATLLAGTLYSLAEEN